ncbi:MAG: pantoate--beta-alanine ligase [Chitinophagaceae bacterium]|nr:pantoate--beta-alanine ligase [Chitinophagaceae bacterium]MBL0057083.1 pantoate--beta-alanine ligase [Chitinophagaceae bacterium]
MILFKKSRDLHDFLKEKRRRDIPVGFVPTMGALHAGHISLIGESRKKGGLTVCSIFVNPTQFNDSKDFDQYPYTLEKDIDGLEAAGCDVLFLPSVKEMYPEGLKNLPHFDLGFLETVLEGKFRPGHFQGVCQVVERLLKMVQPQFLYLGQKDFQQCMVISKLVEIMGIDTRVVICPTQRESDGLAMSSRNLRLSPSEREQAVYIHKTLRFLRQELKPGYLDDMKERAIQYLAAEGFRVDYVEIAEAETLKPVTHWDGSTPLVALIAAFINEVRLIDNLLLQDSH